MSARVAYQNRGSVQSSQSTAVKLLKTLLSLLNHAAFLDGACRRISEEEFETDGMRFRIPREWQSRCDGYIDGAISDFRAVVTELPFRAVPISLVVLVVWVAMGYGFSPCVIYHRVKDYCRKVGLQIKTVLGTEWIMLG